MKKSIYLLLPILLFLIDSSSAQMRGDVSKPVDYQGTIINSQSATIQGKLASFFENNVTMSHSYSMSFSSIGGSYQNLNAYTNTMNVAFSDRISGRFDVSFFHSPFGGSNLYNQGLNQPKVMLSNAELNFQVNDKTNISLQYKRVPYSPYGLSPYGYGFNNFNRFNSRYY